MPAISIGQIVFYAVVLIAFGLPLGLYMARVYSVEGGSSHGASGSARSSAASTASSAPIRRRSRTGRATRSRWSSRPSSPSSSTGCSVFRTTSSSTRTTSRRSVAHLAQHHGQLRDEHELAVLRRRVHDVVPEPDGRARRAELRLCRGRHGRPRRGDPRLHAPLDDERSATSGRTSTGRDLHPAAALDRPVRPAHLAGRSADLRRRGDRDDGRGRRAVDRPRSGRVADRHQAARHERRRLLQLELGRALREPERAHELPRDALDPAHPGRPRLHVREDGRARGSRATPSSPPCSRCSSSASP